MKSVREKSFLSRRFAVNRYKMEALLANIPRIIYMEDTDGNYIIGTKQAEKFIKYGIDVLHGIKLDVNKDINFACGKYDFAEGKPVSYEEKFYDTNGIIHRYSTCKTPICDYSGNYSGGGVVVMTDNIDEACALEEQRETFVASLSHDLKNPALAQIRAIELLLKGSLGGFNNKQQEILEMVLDSCRYMNSMLSSLLATYRYEKGAVKLNYEKFSFTDLAAECAEEMFYYAKDKGIGIFLTDNSEVKNVYADKVQIKQVIMNLLSNGIKYSYKNSPLNITLYNEQNRICFNFENKSPYIPSEKRKAIFAQYVSFSSAYNESGTGLGLYASQKIVEAHEGEIFVRSYKDDRNIFGFALPIGIVDGEKSRSVIF